LIILDVLMPGMDGMELLQRLRDNPETQQIPVIVFTGKSDVRLPEEFSLVSVVSKNSGVSALKVRIAEVLRA
jgi:CheY-like chemotaxis protein